MKTTVLESGNEALKPMGADGLKKKQFIVCRTNSKVKLARDTLNDSKWITHIQNILLYLGHWEKFHFFSLWILTWYVYNLINIFIYSSQPPTNECERT